MKKGWGHDHWVGLQTQGHEDGVQDEARGEDEQLDQSDSEHMYLVRKPGEAEEEDDDDEHLDDPLLVGQHRPIPHSVPLARCPVECHQNCADFSLANLAPQSLAAILEHSIVSKGHFNTILPPGVLPTLPGALYTRWTRCHFWLFYHLAIGFGANVPDVSIKPPGVGDGECQQREQVLSGCQHKAIPVERRTLHNRRVFTCVMKTKFPKEWTLSLLLQVLFGVFYLSFF